MKIRITGSDAELDHAVRCIATVLPVREVSRLYANRNVVTSRVYLDIGPLPQAEGSGAS